MGQSLFRSVLCPIDFSKHSALALRYAEAMARRANASLTITHANDPLLVAAAGVRLNDREIARVSAEELETFVSKTLKSSSKTPVPVRCETTIGDAADDILNIVSQQGCDLIVMGTHGITGPNRLILGSTTLNILQRTTVPVLAVPRHRQPAIMRKWPARVLAPLELTTESGREAALAGQIAAWFEARLVLLHVVDDVAGPAWIKRHAAAATRTRLEHARRELDALAKALPAAKPIQARVVSGHPANEIAKQATAVRAELLVTALRDQEGWFGARRGSVSYHVLAHAVAPVLAYPPRWKLGGARKVRDVLEGPL